MNPTYSQPPFGAQPRPFTPQGYVTGQNPHYAQNQMPPQQTNTGYFPAPFNTNAQISGPGFQGGLQLGSLPQPQLHQPQSSILQSPATQGYVTSQNPHYAQNQMPPQQTNTGNFPPASFNTNAQTSGPGLPQPQLHQPQSSILQSPPAPQMPLGNQGYVSSPESQYPSSVPGYINAPPRVGTPGGTSKKQQWIQKSIETTRILQSGQLQTNPIVWSFVSSGSPLPPNVINLGSDSGPVYLCRSYYENQLRIGRVSTGPHGLKACVVHKGKECPVNEYEVLVQAAGQPQWPFVQSQSIIQSQTNMNLPVAQPAPAPVPGPALSGLDLVFIVDDSDSMEGRRWNDLRNALSRVAQSCSQFDSDGFDLYFLNNEYVQHDITNGDTISRIFKEIGPDGGTPTGARLRKVLENYFPRIEEKTRPSKPVGIVVITDGESDPSDIPEENLEQVIVNAARRLEHAQVPNTQLYIHFVQIGDDADAAASLRHLDDALSNKYGIRDIVEASADTTIPEPHQTQFTTQTLYSILHSMWKKQTNQMSFTTFDPSAPQTLSPLPFSQTNLPPFHSNALPLSPLAIEVTNPNGPQRSLSDFTTQVTTTHYESHQYHSQQPAVTAMPQSAQASVQRQPTPVFNNKKDWIQKARLSTAALKASVSSYFTAPFAWILVESALPPSNAIVCGNENGLDTFLCRSFYEGQMRYGTVTAGSTKATITNNNNRETSIENFEVLVQPSAVFFSFVPAPVPPSRKMDIVLIVDDSDSMAGHLWAQARDALAAVAEASPQFDADGVDMFFLNSDRSQKGLRTRSEVVRLFNEVLPDGGTPTGHRLQQVLNEYIPKVEQKMLPVKPVNIIVITDGDPSQFSRSLFIQGSHSNVDKPLSADDVESVIVNAAQRLQIAHVPDRMLGIQFVQIGEDPEATRALRELDIDLEKKYHIRDMVDTTLFDATNANFKEDTIIKVLWGAIDKQVDHRGEHHSRF
ncbi:hypothetical protein VKT23_006218 [Stygiomarasmius scandens]|uniref:VWFA domain-containing protein n=1 Tax=Marasmiellus scandens TaxID=2682957 RepID=A0ABR1JQ74_9AGAR